MPNETMVEPTHNEHILWQSLFINFQSFCQSHWQFESSWQVLDAHNMQTNDKWSTHKAWLCDYMTSTHTYTCTYKYNGYDIFLMMLWGFFWDHKLSPL